MTLPLALDIIILCLLAATIFFAARLSLHLKAFRSNRAALDGIIKELAEQIAQAERAVMGMREAAREGGRDLQERINAARALAEELQFMNETGNNLAGRLEKAATGGSRAPAADMFDGEGEPAARGGFAIRDPDFDGEGDVEEEDALFFESDDDRTDELQSRAERELFAALQGRGGKAGGRG
jgi:hypothetical protein